MLRRTWGRLSGTAAVTLPTLTPAPHGIAATPSWRLYMKDASTQALRSAWHDLPLRPAAAADPRLLISVTEIPRGTRAKLELCKEEPHNPIKQDVVAGASGPSLRCFAYGDIPFNYGFLPRTWEDPRHVDARTGCVGDGDPVDVVHLGAAHHIGAYGPVRVLGVLGLIDQGETDWKIIVESVDAAGGGGGYDTLAKVPLELRVAIVDWFENYKVAEGKQKNVFAFDKEIRGADTALEIIAQCAAQYDALVAGTCGDAGYWLR
ncbi:inorganic pyrophosphatase [Novymonas esmeraldas]|uniref:inorganic diphosphatase n=1 Tax=Novymonas esmeraldas TaxID=1808958 RepID=A0AAW0EUL1_9TRYP